MTNQWTKKITLNLEDGVWTISEHHDSDNSWTQRIHNNLDRRWCLPVSVEIDDDDLIDHIKEDGEILILVSELRKGFEVEWDGSNYVGSHPNHDSPEIVDLQISEYFDNPDNYPTGREYWDAGDWFQDSDDAAKEFGITAKTTDEKLAIIVEKHGDGDSDVIFEDGTFETWAERAREDMIEDEEEDID